MKFNIIKKCCYIVTGIALILLTSILITKVNARFNMIESYKNESLIRDLRLFTANTMGQYVGGNIASSGRTMHLSHENGVLSGVLNMTYGVENKIAEKIRLDTPGIISNLEFIFSRELLEKYKISYIVTIEDHWKLKNRSLVNIQIRINE